MGVSYKLSVVVFTIGLGCVILPAVADSALAGSATGMVVKPTNNKNSRFISAKNNLGIAFQISAGESIDRSIANNFASYFGIQPNELVTKKTKTTSTQGQVIRYQQQYNGVDIIGAELIANVNAKNNLTSISGETSRDLDLNTQFQISAIEAQATAVSAVTKWTGLVAADLYVTTPALKIYDPQLISPFQTSPELVWEMEVLPVAVRPLRQYVLVNAINGHITLNFNKIDTALVLSTHTANNLTTLPGTFICDQTDLTCAAGDTDAMSAHAYAADTYNFYSTTHGRDGIDGAGMTIVSSVHFGPVGYMNAFWDGTQMAYGDGFSRADDVVAHELTHGVTDKESNLMYWFQSGAINESLSDIWGEFVDLTNTGGTDTPAVRWQLGEDVSRY